MKDFIKNIFDSDSPISSKRVAAFLALLTTIFGAIFAMFKSNGIMPDTFFQGLLYFAAIALGITGAETIFKTKNKPKNEKPDTILDTQEIAKGNTDTDDTNPK